MGTTNYGTQENVYRYLQEATSEGFNKLLYGVTKSGVYSGLTLAITGVNGLIVSPGVMYVEDSTAELGMRCKTTTEETLQMTASASYLVARLTWVNTENNYVDFLPVEQANIRSTDIIFGQAVYIGGSISSISYAETTYSPTIDTNEKVSWFKLMPKRTSSFKEVIIGQGYIINNNEKQEVLEQTLSVPDCSLGRYDIVGLEKDGTSVLIQGNDLASPVLPSIPSNVIKVIGYIRRDGEGLLVSGNHIEQISYFEDQSHVTAQSVKEQDTPVNGSFGTELYGHLLDAIDLKNGYRGSFSSNPTPIWVAGIYDAGTSLKHNNFYWYVGNGLTTTDEPLKETDWFMSPVYDEAIRLTKNITLSGIGSISDPKSTDFLNYYKIGEYINGSVEEELFRINVANQLTGDNTTDFYKLVDASAINSLFATHSAGEYQLSDYRGCVVSAGDVSGGNRAANGVKQEDAFQGHDRDLASTAGTDGVFTNDGYGTGPLADGQDTDTNDRGENPTIITKNYYDDGTNGIPRIASETRMKNVANGILCIHVLITRGVITSISG